MKADPRVRKDNLCAQCGKPRKMPKNRQKGVDPTVYARDPFCSSVCARAWHDNPLSPLGPGYDPDEKRGRHERVAA